MKHIANIMRTNDWNIDQESTVGRIFTKGRGKAKKHLIVWLDGTKEEFGRDFVAVCAHGLNADISNFIHPL